MNFDIDKHKIFETITGSHVFGTNTPESDIDYRGIVIPPHNILNSIFLQFDQHESKNPDRVMFSLKKFCVLATECNPSIVEFFFIDKKFYIFTSKWWELLKENRHLFLSTRARHTFSGYALSQLKRVKRHKRWIDNPPKEPKPEDFNLSHKMLLGKNEIGAYDALESCGLEFSREIVHLMGRVKSYHSALKEWHTYQDWKAGRNPKRAELETKAGYDSKHVYHLVRLIRLGEELLTTGNMTLSDRADQEELVAVRNGEWAYEKVLEFAEAIDSRMNEFEVNSVLPKKPNREEIDKLYQNIIWDYHFPG